MIPPSFEYLTPSYISDAVALLQKHGDEAKILAGGHSLIPAMRLRLAEPGYLIDISGIGGLDYIQEESGQLRIGAMTCEAALEESDIVQSKYPLLLDTAKMIADPSVRNMATVGGNLAHGDPANDHPATMLALRASVIAEGPNGTREIKIDNFFPDFFTTALSEDEILTEIRIPSPPSARGWIRISWSSPRAVLIDSATVCAEAVPLNLSGATRILIRGLQYHSSGGYRSDPKRTRTLASARSSTGRAAGNGRTFAESTPIIKPTFLASSS